MTPEQKNLVQETFALVAPIADQAGELFYSRLFEVDPTLRSLFRGDIQEQSKKLMQMLAVAVASLDDIDRIAPALHALGRRHVDYGVTKQHFSTVATALLWTLEMGLGARWTPDVEQAWVAAYTVLVATMQEAMWFDDDAADEAVEVAA